MRPPLVALAGNPNTGKTALFNRLTGGRGRVGNYPGVTVERLEGEWRLGGGGARARLLDVPGTYSLNARSEEERIALKSLTGLGSGQAPDLVLCVLDATQLHRNLYLAVQLLELEVPLVIAVNLADVLEAQGRALDTDAMSAALGVPVVAVSARTGAGIERLTEAVRQTLATPPEPAPWVWEPHDGPVGADLDAVVEALPADWRSGPPRRAEAVALWSLLSIDSADELRGIPDSLRAHVADRHAAAASSGRSIDEEVVAGRYGWIETHLERFLPPATDRGPSPTRRIDGLLLHPFLGFPLFVGLMAVLFQSLFTWSDPMIGAIEQAFGWLGARVADWMPDGMLESLVVDGLIAGVGGVLVFLPQILLLFLFIAVMEDTGYMARVAFLMDRIMRSVGLHGRAFVPMLSGFACAIPAVMATRTIERERDRVLTMLVVPLMTCSARLPVYTLMIAALFPAGDTAGWSRGLAMTGMYLLSTVTALVAAAVIGRTVLKGARPPLVIEMPPYRLPQVASVLRTMYERSAVFVREAGTVILVCTLALWALLSFPAEPRLEPELAAAVSAAEVSAESGERAALETQVRAEQLRQSYAGRLGHLIEPALEPLGFDWQIGVGLIGAFAAREVFVSTMAVVYGLGEEADEHNLGLRERLREERRPDGRRLFTPLTSLSLMVFFAFAAQCMSTLAAVHRETRGWRWPLFLFGYMTALAWGSSFLVYQGGRLLGFE
jgi:ferrous iron transport protein B